MPNEEVHIIWNEDGHQWSKNHKKVPPKSALLLFIMILAAEAHQSHGSIPNNTVWCAIQKNQSKKLRIHFLDILQDKEINL